MTSPFFRGGVKNWVKFMMLSRKVEKWWYWSGVEVKVKRPEIKLFREVIYTANPVPVMKAGIPCAHILTGKTCFNHRENLFSLQSHYRDPVLIEGNLFSKQGLPCMLPVLPCTALQCMEEPLGTAFAHACHRIEFHVEFGLRGPQIKNV
jgi:hypothetical protein